MSTPKNSGSSVDPITLGEFMSALQRLFKIGIYYPSGHAILDKATTRFMGVLLTLAAEKQSITLQDYENSLMLEGIKVDPAHPFVMDFKNILSVLGITAITIDRNISMSELHIFVRKMLFYKSKAINLKEFTQIEVSELPPSITIDLKEFLARKDATISESSSGETAENLEIFYEALGSYGLDGTQISQCKNLLDSLSADIANNEVETGNLPHASWNDVARLLAGTVKKNQQSKAETNEYLANFSSINSLASILEKLESETEDKRSRETINHLVSLIKKPSSEAQKKVVGFEKPKYTAFPDTPVDTIKEIQEWVTKNILPQKTLKELPLISSDEEALSMLMLLAQHSQKTQSQVRIQQFLREILSHEVAEKIWEILSCGVQQIIKTANHTRISSVLRHIIEPLRRSKHGNSLHFLLLTFKVCNEEEAKNLWPYTVNEMLISGSNVDTSSYRQLCQLTSQLSQEDMQAALPLLENLEAFQDGAIAPDIFHAVNPKGYPLFAFLFKTEISQFVGERILGGLRRHPADWLIKALIPLLDLSQQEHNMFLYSYLRQAAQKVIPPSLKNVAAKIACESLIALSQERRNETWTINSIRTLAELQTKDTQELLQQIASSKKMLFIHEWPAECRKAAELALRSSKQKR